ncbi:hypothetical protein HMPREF1503_0393, partial [Olsenella uli MSTE5]
MTDDPHQRGETMAKYENANRVVIALGGNALGDTPEE